MSEQVHLFTRSGYSMFGVNSQIPSAACSALARTPDNCDASHAPAAAVYKVKNHAQQTGPPEATAVG